MYPSVYPGNNIDPTAIVGPYVRMGEGNVIGPYSVITGRTVLGNNNWIAPHVVIGTPAEWRGRPLHQGWDGQEGVSGVHIGNGNVIREFVTINAGTDQLTMIRDECYLMTKSHVGHDVFVDFLVTLSPTAMLGGYSRIWKHANIGMGASIRQRVVVGPGAMIGMNATITKTVEPFSMVVGVDRVLGANARLMQSLGASPSQIDQWEKQTSSMGLPPEIFKLIHAFRVREK